MRRCISFATVAITAAVDLGSGDFFQASQGHSHGSRKKQGGFGGSEMERTFMSYKSLPVGDDALKEAGWHKHDGDPCNPHLGFAWTESAEGATKDTPLKLYTTAGGQPAGVGTVIFGSAEKPPLPEAQKKWASSVPMVGPLGVDYAEHIDVAFRSGDIICSGERSGDVSNMGDTLIVNPLDSSNYKVLPLTEDGIEKEGWHKGSCFDGMGWHWFLDTAVGNNQLSWKAENLFPVVTMYDKGQLNAIFFASTINQVSIPIFKSNEWEPKALSDSEMCGNLCDKDCTFPGTPGNGPWSTQHVYFRDHSSVTCDQDLKCAYSGFPFRGSCCAADTSDVLV